MPKEQLNQKNELLKRAQKARIKAKESAKKFKAETKKAISTAIVAAFGFIIALVWKEVITEYMATITAISPVGGKLIEALVITVVAVLGILIITKLFAEKN